MNGIHYTKPRDPHDERLRCVVVGDEAFKSKGLGTLVSVGAIAIIPMAAPALASAIGASTAIQGAAQGFLSTARAERLGQIAGSAITGAAMGAVSAKVAGRDVNEGALWGAGVGGIGGWWQSRPVAAAGGVGGVPPTNTPGNLVGHPQNPGSPGGGPGGGVGGEGPSFFDKLKEGASAVPGIVADRVTDPEFITDALALFGTEALGSALGVGEMTAEQKAAVEAQRRELEAMRRTNVDLYNRRVAAAEQLLQQARQNDPAYLATLRGNTARIAAARQGAQQRRAAAFSGREHTAGDARRAGLGVTRAAGTAYDRGFTAGLQRQAGLTEAGLRSLPAGYDASSVAHRGSLLNSFTDIREQRNREEDAFAKWRELLAGNERVPAGGAGGAS